MADGLRYGPSRIVFSGDKVRAQGYLPKALQLLRRTQERQRLGGLNVLRDHLDLDADAYCYVVLGGGMAAVHIVAGYAEAEDRQTIEREVIPDFVSGVVREGHLELVEGERRALATFHPTQQCVQRYEPPQGRRAVEPITYAWQRIARLAVEPLDEFIDLRNPDPDSPIEFSQYTRLKPTMYSGAMRWLVQALMGFGRQRRRPSEDGEGRDVSLYEFLEVKPAEQDLDGGTAQKPGREKAQYVEDVREKGLQIRYDWRFYRTHGLTRAADGRVWLVEVSSAQGVIAMPIELHAATTTDDFREHLQDVDDIDALRLLDEFGGFPTGEPFPSSKYLDGWIRAGRVVRLVSREALQEFYSHTAYSAEMGWAFNLRGDEAHNTAWRYGDDEVQRGVHYAIALHIGATRKVEPSSTAGELRGRLERLRGRAEFEANIEAAIWKCDRLTADQRRQAAETGRVEELFAYIDGLVLDPMAPSSGSVSKVSEGNLWFSPLAIEDSGNIIRFPELAVGYLVSHSMKPASRQAVAPLLCDTTMHVFFVGNELKWVKFYWDMRPGAPPRSEDDYEDCMYIGRWSRHQETGARRVPMLFYTNDFDDREELAASTVDTVIESKDLGYSSVDVFDKGIPYANEGGIGRTKRFQRKTEVRSVFSPGIGSGVAVPFGDRESYYYAVYRHNAGTQREVTHAYSYLSDPHRYQHWRNRAPWSGGEWTENGTGWPPSDGEPPGTTQWLKLNQHPTGYGPVTVRTVCTPGVDYVVNNWLTGAEGRDGETYFPYPCGDAADSGPWLNGGENATLLAYSIPEAPLPENELEVNPATGGYDVWWVSSSGFGPLRVRRVAGGGFGLWGQATPAAETGLTQTIDVAYNALGDAQSARYSLDLNGPSELRGVPAYPGMESRPLTYIGVINSG